MILQLKELDDQIMSKLEKKFYWQWLYVLCRASQVMLVVEDQPANAGDIRDKGSIPGSGRCPGCGHSNLFQCSCLENPMDRGAWWATVHRVAELDTTEWLSHKHQITFWGANLPAMLDFLFFKWFYLFLAV